MSKITVKSEFLSDIRRFPVNTQIKFNDFVETVKNLYKIDKIRLKYKDEEGDIITITNDDELLEALEYGQRSKNLLRLIVQEGSLFESWVLVDNNEVRELCNEIKALTNQLTSNINNDNNMNGLIQNVKEIAPTAAKYYEQASPKPLLSGSFLADQLPSWGKKSMYAEDFAHEQNQVNNLLEGPRTDLINQIPANNNNNAKPQKSTKISQVVAENSVSIVKDLKELTSKIANLVIQSGGMSSHMKDDLIQTNMKLAEMTISTCQVFSDNASNICTESSNRAKDLVNSAVEKLNNDCDHSGKRDQDQVCDSLRSVTLQNCSDLSHSTAENCMKGANSIRDLIMNL